jgi:ABC-type glycerol-3-phosphate transport system substrate-binding protein
MKSTEPAPTSAVSRRMFLQFLTAGGAVVAGGATLSACSSGGGTSAASSTTAAPSISDVTLKLGGTSSTVPYHPLHSAAEVAKDVNAKAYNVALQEFLDKNPGVKFETVQLDMWDGNAVKTALAGGSAPAFNVFNVVGQWQAPLTRQAMAQELSADVTQQVKDLGFLEKLNPEVRPSLDYFSVDGKYFALPYEYSGVGQGFYIRRDLVEQAGVALPDPESPDWNWEKVREIAKATTKGDVKGMAWVSWGMWPVVNSAVPDYIRDTPAPGTNWNYTTDWNYDEIAQAATAVRGMILEDKSVFGGTQYGGKDDAILDAFRSGKAAMVLQNPSRLFSNPKDSTAFIAQPWAEGKKWEDLVVWYPVPKGPTGAWEDGSRDVALIGFSPDLDDNAKLAAVALHTHMQGPGLVRQQQTLFAETKDLRTVYTASPAASAIPSATVFPIFSSTSQELAKLGTVQKAWGTELLAPIERVRKRPVQPLRDLYVKQVETGAAPPGDTYNDTISNLSFKPGVDVKAELRRTSDTWNQQSASFRSSIGDDEFKAGVTSWVDALDRFWQQNAPDFHARTVKPWIDGKVKPNLA